MDLVICLERWLRTCDFLGDDPLIYVDSPASSIQKTPFLIDSYRPDVYAKSRQFDREVIGEATTPKDLNTTRSKNQLEAFLRRSTESTNCALIIATRWDYVRYANSTLKCLYSCRDISKPNYAILDQFGNVRVISNDWI